MKRSRQVSKHPLASQEENVEIPLTKNIMHNDKVLRQIQVKIAENTRQGIESLAVFDLDSTLFDVAPRLKRILLDISASKDFRQKYARELEYFRSIDIHPTDWGIADALKRRAVTDPDPQFLEEVKLFWRKQFFSNEYLEFDIPYAGSVRYLQRLAESGAHIAYLTGRDVHRMGPGSLKILEKWKFPVGHKAELVLKPHRDMEDRRFKTDWFRVLPPNRYADVWFFENEPVNVNDLRSHLPDIRVVFFDSTHSRKESAPTDIDWIRHFLFSTEGG